MKLHNKVRLFLGIGIVGLVAVAAALGVIITKPKPKQTESMATLFVYNPQKGTGTEGLPSFADDEPAFSIQLPDGWYFDKRRTGNKRLVAQSPATPVKGYEFRATIIISMVPTNHGLDEEVAIAKKEIGRMTVGGAFQTAKAISLHGWRGYQLEYELYTSRDTEDIKASIGEERPTIHTVDIIAVKDGYFVDIAASSFSWNWKDYTAAIEKSLNSFAFLK